MVDKEENRCNQQMDDENDARDALLGEEVIMITLSVGLTSYDGRSQLGRVGAPTRKCAGVVGTWPSR